MERWRQSKLSCAAEKIADRLVDKLSAVCTLLRDWIDPFLEGAKGAFFNNLQAHMDIGLEPFLMAFYLEVWVYSTQTIH